MKNSEELKNRFELAEERLVNLRIDQLGLSSLRNNNKKNEENE